jgi:Domain of unknown function (DUF4190)
MSTQEYAGIATSQGRRQQYRNGMGTGALVVGIIALVLAVLVIFFPIAFVLGILATIFGVVGAKRVARGEASNKGNAVAGLVCGALALVLSLSIGARLGTDAFAESGEVREFWTCLMSGPTERELERCSETIGRELDASPWGWFW